MQCLLNIYHKLLKPCPQLLIVTGLILDVQVNIKDAYIELALSRGRLMDIRLDELEVSDADGFVLTVQKANVSFNPFWLLLGRLSLRDVELEKPYIQINLNTQQQKDDNKRAKS